MEYPDNEDREMGSLQQVNEQQQMKNNLYVQNSHLSAGESPTTDALDKSMLFICFWEKIQTDHF